MSTRIWKQGLLVAPGVGVSLLPKLICPLCWPAYAGLMSTVGLGFLISTAYLFPITAALLVLAIGSLGFRASRRHGLGPFWVGVAAGVSILAGKFYLESPFTTYSGVGLLLVASVWNALPSRTHIAICTACISADGDQMQRKGETQP